MRIKIPTSLCKANISPLDLETPEKIPQAAAIVSALVLENASLVTLGPNRPLSCLSAAGVL